MKWIRMVSSIGALVWSLCLPAQQTLMTQSSRPLVNLTMAHNRDLLAVQERIKEAQGLLRQAGVRPIPTLEAEGASGRPLGTKGEEEFSAGYSYLVETAGKRDKRVRVAQQVLALASAEFEERLRFLAREINDREIDVLVEREKLAALDRVSRINQEAYRLTEARVQRGDAAALDLQLLSVENNRTEAQRLSAQGRAETAVLDLRRIVGINAAAELPLATALASPEITMTVADLSALGLRVRPDLRVAKTVEAQADAEVSLTEALARPDVTVEAKYARRNSAFDQFGLDAGGSRVPLRDRDNVVSLGVSVPLLTRRHNQGSIDASVSRERSARLRREYLDGAIPLEIDAAYRRWNAARRATTMLSQGVVEQSEKNLVVIRQAYQLGQLRLLDVLNEQRRLLETELGYIDAKAELARAAVGLEHAVGGKLP